MFGAAGGLCESSLCGFVFGQSQQHATHLGRQKLSRGVHPFLEFDAPIWQRKTLEKTACVQRWHALEVLFTNRLEQARNITLERQTHPLPVVVQNTRFTLADLSERHAQTCGGLARFRPEEFSQMTAVLRALNRQVREQQQGFRTPKIRILEPQAAKRLQAHRQNLTPIWRLRPVYATLRIL